MTKFLASILFAISVSGLVAQPAAKKIDSLHSSILGENRIIFIHNPATTSATQRLPVIYVLDAEVLFEPTVDNLRKLNLADKVIVVGIGNLWLRYRDYSPSHISSSPYVDSYSASITGGGDRFISFIEKELIPYVRNHYPAASKRALIGHSMGGLITMDIFLKHTSLFNAYAAIDPSIWWDNQKLLGEAKSILKSSKYENVFLFLAAANTTNKEMTEAQLKADTSEKTAVIRPTFILADYIIANKESKLKFNLKYYVNENHMSVFSPATIDALKPILVFLTSSH